MMGHTFEHNHPVAHHPGAQSTPEGLSSLVAELQRENIRLQLMVSELLLRNQQLRAEQRAQPVAWAEPQ